MNLFGVAGETHRNYRRSRQQGVLLPLLEGNCRQHVVVADDNIGRPVGRSAHRRFETDGVRCQNAQLSEVPGDVLAQNAMARDTQCAQRRGWSWYWRCPVLRSAPVILYMHCWSIVRLPGPEHKSAPLK